MSKGDLNGEAILQAPVSGTPDPGGHVDLEDESIWRSLGRYRFTAILGPTSKEVWRAKQVQSNVTHIVEVWYSKITSQIDTSMRWVVGTRKFQIRSVVDVEELHQVIRLELTERT